MSQGSERMRDSAFASNIPTSWKGAVAGYVAGGDPFHVWTKAEWARFPRNRKLPIFVQSNPQRANPTNDAIQCIKDLANLGVTKGCIVALDLETGIDRGYVAQFGHVLNTCSFKVWPYGSVSSLFANPVLDGWWVADYKGIGPFMENHPNVRATQYADPPASGGQWDSSTVKWYQYYRGKWWR